MTVSEAVLVGVFCMSLVFAILAVLYFLIRIFTVGIRKFENKHTEKSDQR
ncbi:OadG family protein [Faecalispora anaeroviscerum]|nr:OadG family protein [Faecalispora anaeroviscerum]